MSNRIHSSDPINQAVDLLITKDTDVSTLLQEGGLLDQLTKRLVEKALTSEMDNHLGYGKYCHNGTNNARNGHNVKNVITSNNGVVELAVPRDRNSTFEPKLIPKRQRRLDGFNQKVLSFYAKGMSISDIRLQLEELYGADMSERLISQITDDILEDVKAWQNRPLDQLYAIVYFDCIIVKVRQDKRIINKAVYIALGIDLSGRKDILGLWISENEGAKFWLSNFTELKNRGMQDMLIARSDNLTGISQAIEAVYPKTEHQVSIRAL